MSAKQDQIDWHKTRTVADVKARQRERGMHWFAPQAMRFFNTKVHTRELIGGRHFVTSELFGTMMGGVGHRRYTVRRVMPNFEIETVDGAGGLYGYPTLAQANRTARNLPPRKKEK